MAEVVGTIQCPLCKTEQPVKREARTKACLYIGCGNCGTLQPRLPMGQEYMMQHARIDGAPAPRPEPEPEPEKTEGRLGSWFSELWSEEA